MEQRLSSRKIFYISFLCINHLYFINAIQFPSNIHTISPTTPKLFITDIPTLSPSNNPTDIPTRFRTPTYQPSVQSFPIFSFDSDITLVNVSSNSLNNDIISQDVLIKTTSACMNISFNSVSYITSSEITNTTTTNSLFHTPSLQFPLVPTYLTSILSLLLSRLYNNKMMIYSFFINHVLLYDTLMPSSDYSLVVKMQTSLQITSSNITNAYYIELYHQLTNSLSTSITDGKYYLIIHHNTVISRYIFFHLYFFVFIYLSTIQPNMYIDKHM